MTITGTLVLLVYAIVRAPGEGWGAAATIGPLVGSAVLLAAFVLIESRHPAPLVPLRLFRIRALATADALTVLFGAVAVGMPFVLTLYAQQVLGYSAVKFGVSSVVLAVAVTIGAIGAQGLVGKAGFRPVAVTGAVLLAGGSVVLTQVTPTGGYFPDIFFGLLVAITTTVAVSNSSGFGAAHRAAGAHLVATEGYRAAFWACLVLSGITFALAMVFPGRPKPAGEELPEPLAAASADRPGELA